MIINITDKLSNEKPQIQIGEKIYKVNDTIMSVFKFQELSQSNTKEGIIEAFKLALGEEAVKEIDIENFSISNLKVLIIAILAAMQKIPYEEAEKKFRKF